MRPLDDDDPLYDTDSAAKYLGDYAPATLVWWRCVGRGPVFLKPSGRVRYRKSALDAFLASGTVKPSEAA